MAGELMLPGRRWLLFQRDKVKCHLGALVERSARTLLYRVMFTFIVAPLFFAASTLDTVPENSNMRILYVDYTEVYEHSLCTIL